jgi:L-lactate dehydrogenase (cytochrome)/(S)-mandelate dehydrogenase
MWKPFSSGADRMSRAVNIEDLRRLARRRMPRILFDYIDGGAGDESGLRRNRDAFGAYGITPRYLIDVSARSLAARIWDRTYSAPFGIAPVGIAGLFHPDAECLLARAALEAGIPCILSGASIAPIEQVAQVAGSALWYQLYPARDARISFDIVARAEQAGMDALVLTVDLPVPAKRERDRRNGFNFDAGYSASRILDGLMHPRWTLRYLAHGGMRPFGTWTRYASPGASARQVAQLFDEQSYPTQLWRDLEAYRRAWPRKLVVKGIQHPGDAAKAQAMGADGIIVSNHGGRQLHCLPAAIEVLPRIREAVGEDLAVMVDGGVRNGSDIAIALALGADFVFVGRAPIYGVAAGGLAGVRRAIEILTEELDLTLGQIGISRISELRRDILVERCAFSGSVYNERGVAPRNFES